MIFAAAAVVAIPWYAAVTWSNGAAFLEEFFWKQHLAAFHDRRALHERPFWFYVPVLLAGLFPWSPFCSSCSQNRIYNDRRARFLAAWFVWGFVFFSLSRNKLPGYLLPLLPAAGGVARVGDRENVSARRKNGGAHGCQRRHALVHSRY